MDFYRMGELIPWDSHRDDGRAHPMGFPQGWRESSSHGILAGTGVFSLVLLHGSTCPPDGGIPSRNSFPISHLSLPLPFFTHSSLADPAQRWEWARAAAPEGFLQLFQHFPWAGRKGNSSPAPNGIELPPLALSPHFLQPSRESFVLNQSFVYKETFIYLQVFNFLNPGSCRMFLGAGGIFLQVFLLTAGLLLL